MTFLELQRVKSQLQCSGFDFFHLFSLEWYNKCFRTSSELKFRLNPFPHRGSHCLGILIASSKRFWPVFIDFLKAHPLWRARTNPLDDYVELTVTRAWHSSWKPGQVSAHFAHETADGRLVAMQRLGEASGFAYYFRTAGLSVHKQVGPWFAFRAAIIVDADPPSLSIPKPLPSPCPPGSVRAIDRIMAEIKDTNFQCSWNKWLELRDATEIGQQYRYDEDQIVSPTSSTLLCL